MWTVLSSRLQYDGLQLFKTLRGFSTRFVLTVSSQWKLGTVLHLSLEWQNIIWFCILLFSSNKHTWLQAEKWGLLCVRLLKSEKLTWFDYILFLVSVALFKEAEQMTQWVKGNICTWPQSDENWWWKSYGFPNIINQSKLTFTFVSKDL